MTEMLSIGFAVCILSGLLAFWLFVKCADWFDKI